MSAETFFDTYARLIQECIEDIIKGELEGSTDGLYRLMAQLKQTRPYILTEGVVRMAMDMVNKAGESAVPYEPFLKLPFWIEAQDYSFGSDQEQFIGIFACKDVSNPEMAMVHA